MARPEKAPTVDWELAIVGVERLERELAILKSLIRNNARGEVSKGDQGSP
jgi:hypothetical protein